MNVRAELKSWGVRDVFFVVCDGLSGLPGSVNTVFSQAIVQACVIHLIRATTGQVKVSTELGPDPPVPCVPIDARAKSSGRHVARDVARHIEMGL